ncbi:hypothetical protein D0Y65_009402 [Glycine soja]|uniref:Uncharacterized protein n=2 Tax=Glycine soja TaxID=3848 RepID=A0A445KYV9_GLYSO|nr:hypothetical protein D0Y65_009402 [Glycine soja]
MYMRLLGVYGDFWLVFVVGEGKMIAAANAGYRAIAFDFRGYGLSEHPAEPQKANLLDLVDDVVGPLDSLSITKEAGRAEADFVRFDVKSVIRNIYTFFSRSEIPITGDNQEIMDLYDPTTALPLGVEMSQAKPSFIRLELGLS